MNRKNDVYLKYTYFAFTVTFEQFNMSLLNKNINFLKKNVNWECTYF